MNNGKQRTGFWSRLIETIRTWEDAMDYTATDHALDRIGNLEREAAQLKDKLPAGSRSERARLPAEAA